MVKVDQDTKKLFKKFINECSRMYRPSGQTDNANRWIPTDSERFSCCEGIRSPSRAYPWSMYKHCHSKKHIKCLLSERYSIDCYEDLPLLINEPNLFFRDLAQKFLTSDTSVHI